MGNLNLSVPQNKNVTLNCKELKFLGKSLSGGQNELFVMPKVSCQKRKAIELIASDQD